jgi:hypothetical protein
VDQRSRARVGAIVGRQRATRRTPVTDESPVLLAVQSTAYAGLDALLSIMPLDLCAYLHVGENLGPQLYLRRPALAELDPADAFRLFSTLRDEIDIDDDMVSRRVDLFDAVVAVSNGPRSRGLWVAGRRGGELDTNESATARNLGQSIMSVCHLAENTSGSAFGVSVLRVAVDSSDNGASAEVAVDHGNGVAIGRGIAPTPLAAVAWATLDALDPSLKLVAADEDTIDQSRAVLAMIRDDHGASSVGAALSDGGSLRAAAEATIAAVSSLRA